MKCLLQSICKLSPLTNGVTGSKPFANGLIFQTVSKRSRPLVTRLDAKDRFRLCVDLTSLSIVRTVYKPYMLKSPQDIFYPFAATSGALGAERGSRKIK